MIRNTLRTTVTDLIPDYAIDEKDWRAPIIESLTQPSTSTNARQLKDFTIIEGQLYYRVGGGILARAVSEEEARVELE